MNILMCDTQYTFFLYYLLMPYEKFKETFFIFDFCFSPHIVKNLADKGFACHQNNLYSIPLEKRAIERINNKEYLTQLIKEIYNHFNGNVCIYGQDHIDIATILWDERIKDIPFNLLEDGMGNYVTRNSLGKDNHNCMGHNNRVNNIFLTGLWRIPNDLKRKVKIIDIRYLWENKSDIERKIFFDFYNIKQETLNELSQKTTCLLGSCFSNFGMMAKDKEIQVYKKIFSNFNKNTTYIKAHPTGGNIEYEREFPGVYVLRNPIPFEVLYLTIGSKLKTIASIASTAAMIADEDVDVQFYDYNGDRIILRYPCDDFI